MEVPVKATMLTRARVYEMTYQRLVEHYPVRGVLISLSVEHRRIEETKRGSKPTERSRAEERDL